MQAYNFIVYTDTQMCVFTLSILVHLQTATTSTDIDRLMGFDEELQKCSAALLVLKLKEQRHVSQVAIQDVIKHSKAQFDRTVSILLAEVRSHLAEKGVDPSELDLDSALSSIILPLNWTRNKQDKYFTDKLGPIVSGHTHPTCMLCTYPMMSC